MTQQYLWARARGIAAIALAVVGTAWWLRTGGWRADSPTVDPRHLGNLGLPLLMLMCVGGAFRALPTRRNLTMRLEAGYGLVAPGSTVWLWQAAFTIALGGAILGGNFTATHADVFGLVLRWVGMLSGITCLVVGTVLAAAAVLWPGQIALTPQGIQYTVGTRTVIAPWSALEPQAPAAPRAGLTGTIDLTVAHSEQIRGGQPDAEGRLGVPAAGYFVNPRVLTGTIAHYLTNAEHRVGIGTRVEYERLTAALSDGTGATDPAR